jgi:hypothetical protein
MNASFVISKDKLVLHPCFGVRDILPLSIFVAAFMVIFSLLVLALVGVPLSIARGEWLGAGVSLIFAGLSAWLSRLAWRTVLQTGPRELRYLPIQDCVEVRRFGWRVQIPRSSVKTIWLRLEVSRGGFKKAAGIWLYLVLERLDGERSSFFLSKLPTLDFANRSEMRSIISQFGQRAGIATSVTEIQEI